MRNMPRILLLRKKSKTFADGFPGPGSDAENIRAINGHWLEILRIFTAAETTT